MEKGFFHPVRGYWQTIGNSDVRASYPQGTAEVPLKPSANMDWNGSEWVASAPEPAPIPEKMTFAQLLIGLVTEGWITEAEGDAWLAGTIPAAASALIATLPQAQRFAGRARAARPSVVLRNDPLVNALAAARGRTQSEMDAFFTTYSAV